MTLNLYKCILIIAKYLKQVLFLAMRSNNKKNRYCVIKLIIEQSPVFKCVSKMGKFSKRVLHIFSPVCLKNNVKTGTSGEKYNYNNIQHYHLPSDKETSLIPTPTRIYIVQPK